jgi:hypothetical protein
MSRRQRKPTTTPGGFLKREKTIQAKYYQILPAMDIDISYGSRHRHKKWRYLFIRLVIIVIQNW